MLAIHRLVVAIMHTPEVDPTFPRAASHQGCELCIVVQRAALDRGLERCFRRIDTGSGSYATYPGVPGPRQVQRLPPKQKKLPHLHVGGIVQSSCTLSSTKWTQRSLFGLPRYCRSISGGGGVAGIRSFSLAYILFRLNGHRSWIGW